MSNRPRVKLPESVKVGDIIEVKTLVTHVMETGHRKTADGEPIPRDILNLFVAKFGEREVFRAEMGPGISANPFISFQMRVEGPGSFTFSWTDDSGRTIVETALLNVEA
jgi:sulfur-oxidizing protein SoxZ